MSLYNRPIWQTNFGQTLRNSQVWIIHFESVCGTTELPSAIGLMHGIQFSFIEGDNVQDDEITLTFAVSEHPLGVDDPCATAYVTFEASAGAQLCSDGSFRLPVIFDGLDEAMAAKCTSTVRIQCLKINSELGEIRQIR